MCRDDPYPSIDKYLSIGEYPVVRTVCRSPVVYERWKEVGPIFGE